MDRDHNVYVCNASGHRVNRITQRGEISVYCDRAPDGPLANPNYGSFDAKGNYYLSDSGNYWKPNGRLIRVRPNGQSESLIGGNWHFPNGLAISPKDGAVFMIESTAADVLRIPVNKDGAMGGTGNLCSITGKHPGWTGFCQEREPVCFVLSPEPHLCRLTRPEYRPPHRGHFRRDIESANKRRLRTPRDTPLLRKPRRSTRRRLRRGRNRRSSPLSQALIRHCAHRHREITPKSPADHVRRPNCPKNNRFKPNWRRIHKSGANPRWTSGGCSGAKKKCRRSQKRSKRNRRRP